MNLLIDPVDRRTGMAILLLAMAAGLREKLHQQQPSRWSTSGEDFPVFADAASRHEEPERWDGMS